MTIRTEAKERKFNMDRSYKKLLKKEKSLESDTKKVLAKDEKRDSLVAAGKKAKRKMKGKGC